MASLSFFKRRVCKQEVVNHAYTQGGQLQVFFHIHIGKRVLSLLFNTATLCDPFCIFTFLNHGLQLKSVHLVLKYVQKFGGLCNKSRQMKRDIILFCYM